MIYAIKERIGKPSLFCGRKNEMQMLLNWVNKIKIERAKSKALLGRRKSGKTAIMERLFNIVWNQNDGIVPFYYEMKDQNKWGLDFACEYIQSCLTQYASFLTRTPLQSAQEIWDWDTIEKKSKQVNNRAIPERIQYFLKYYQQQNVNKSLNIAVETPYRMYDEDHNHFIIMIDEIQYMTRYLYKDKEEKIQAYNFSGILQTH
jgi:AAA+ ATPase superfamily predicted ATPase